MFHRYVFSRELSIKKKKSVANDFDGLTFIDVDNLWTERPVD